MKKVLLGTSALIAAAAISAPAMAQEQIQLGIGGKMEQYFGVTSIDDDAAGFDPTTTGINTDAEVYFTGATTLDNGLTVGAVIQLEAQTNANVTFNADEQYAYIEGAFGQLRAGQKNGILQDLAHTAPQIGISFLDAASFVPSAGLAVGTSQSKLVDTTVSDDSASVSYITPTLAGFSAGVTFNPNPGGALQANQEDGAGTHNKFQVGLAYNGEFSGVGIGVDGSYQTEEADDAIVGADDPTVWRAGLNLAYAGFQAGGSYLRSEDTADTETTTWDAGVAYGVGPYQVGVGYVQTEVDDGTVANDVDEYRQVQLSGSYQMGPGIKAVGGLFWYESESNVGLGTTTTNERDGGGGIVGLALTF
ncbi:hypothetical protein C882_1881 [Caenispirillum salinarum AK4]|uniref:Porin domain-containing protein n=1 Tax=Caenispirillum salinarum AK4 TaxID=1238182 RepID=K9GRK5_9PROT|nr:porin [Caenispirillum salinarum]EKV27379.1 hypothetical protein C882_1881 [Caenispirillum salinarum AK4]